MLNFLGLSKPKITQQTLEQYNIQIVPFNEIKMEKVPSAITGSGTFYKGTYNNEAVSVKMIDITKDPTIVNEFLFWDLYKDNKNFLQMRGACIHGNNVYVIFEFFAFTLDTALKQNLITEDNRDDLAKQCLYILSKLQTEGKKTTDIRPGVFGITENVVVKILDFGILINSERLINNDAIVASRIKYQPPEYFNFQGDDLNYDIWSFGVLLLDLYSIEGAVYNNDKLTLNELSKKVPKGEFPIIPNDISPMLQNILKRCFERNYQKRIKINEFVEEMTTFFDYKEDNTVTTEETFEVDENGTLDECYKFASQVDNAISDVSYLINNKYINDVEDMIDSVKGYQENSLSRLKENFEEIKNTIQKLYDFNVDMLTKFQTQTINQLLIMKQYYICALDDIQKTKKLSNEIKRGISSLRNKKTKATEDVISSFKKTEEQIKYNIQKFSGEAPYDKISKLYYDNVSTVQMFKNIATNELTTLYRYAYDMREHKTNFESNADVFNLSSRLGIEDDIITRVSNDNAVQMAKKLNDVYVKTNGGSNFFVVFNMYDKKIFNITLPNETNLCFKSYSYYDIESKTVYISGGMRDLNDKSSYDTSFLRIKIKVVNSEFEFEFNTLNDMLFKHSSHLMLKHKDYLVVISGTNTKKCEAYSIKDNSWKEIPELPDSLTNASGAVVNGTIYIFGESSSIYKIDTKCIETEESNIEWNYVNYSLNEGKLHRGMGAIFFKNELLILGGFDYNNSFDDVYRIKFKEDNILKDVGEKVKKGGTGLFAKITGIKKEEKKEEKEIVKDETELEIVKSRETLPNKAYFNSNIVIAEQTLVMMDSSNIAIEYDTLTKEFYNYA